MDVLEQVAAWRAQGEQVALATVIETWGSAPRPVGSQLAVTRSGRIAGSVSGGCIETAVAEAALETLSTGTVNLLEFGVTNDQAWEVGLACGGQLTVLVEPVA
jgi:xanthine dehydrogenase accessory factor